MEGVFRVQAAITRVECRRHGFDWLWLELRENCLLYVLLYVVVVRDRGHWTEQEVALRVVMCVRVLGVVCALGGRMVRSSRSSFVAVVARLLW